jgi:peptide/nickel transport system ATP-binding protein
MLVAEGIVKRFPARRTLLDRVLRRPAHALTAVAGVDLTLHRGEIVGLVGESGCGKSTLSKCLAGLLRPDAGHVRLHGDAHAGAEARTRPQRLQMIFQDPYASLNPRLTIGSALAEVIHVHAGLTGDAARARVIGVLDEVGLGAEFAERLPHELSGGQRQRVSIARALAVEPDVIIADEPVSALDVSVQAQIINLLKKLSHDRQLTLLFVSHDLSVVFNLCDRVAVMYLGEVVEVQPSDAMIAGPRHPYARALLAAAPVADPDVPRLAAAVIGEPPDPYSTFDGCRFAGRCPHVDARCTGERPGLRRLPAPDGECWVRCHHAESLPQPTMPRGATA